MAVVFPLFLMSYSNSLIRSSRRLCQDVFVDGERLGEYVGSSEWGPGDLRAVGIA